MHRFIVFLIICFLFSVQIFHCKAYSYRNFDNKYNYNEYNGTTDVSLNNYEEVLFIVDYSGSMNEKLGFTPKAYLVTDAINNILNDSNAAVKIGLRIFGITDKNVLSFDRNGVTYDKNAICTASSLVLPIARYNSQNIEDKLSNISPQGATPIGYSLRQAVKNDFSNTSSMKHIILITDGKENCGDDPCLYIKKLMTLRDDIKIDVIGITVDENAYSQLKCIANAGKGNFYSINSEDEVDITFKQVFNLKPPQIHKETKVRTDLYSDKPKPLNADSGIKYKNYVFEFDY